MGKGREIERERDILYIIIHVFIYCFVILGYLKKCFVVRFTAQPRLGKPWGAIHTIFLI